MEAPRKLLAEQIPVILRTGKCVLGSKETYVAVKTRKAKLAIIAKNTRRDLRERILEAAERRKIPVLVFDGSSVELGIVCGKPYVVSALAVLDFGMSRLKKVVAK